MIIRTINGVQKNYKNNMKTVKFELTDNDKMPFYNAQHVTAEISLNGDTVDDYLQAFKAFLMACGFAEETITTIQTEEQFYLNAEKDLT